MAAPLTTSHWIPDDSGPPVRDVTIGAVLREVAADGARPRRARRGLTRSGGPPTVDVRRAPAGRRALCASGCSVTFEPGEHVGVWAHNLPGVGRARVRRRARRPHARHGEPERSNRPRSRTCSGSRSRSACSSCPRCGATRSSRTSRPCAGPARAARGAAPRPARRALRRPRPPAVRCRRSARTTRCRSSTRAARPASRREPCCITWAW